MPNLPVWFDDPLEDYSPIGQWFDEQLDVAAAPNAYTLTAAAGSFAEVGTDASFTRTLKLVSAVGSFSEVGKDATFKRTYSLAAASGGCSEVGNPATLKRTYIAIATNASFSIIGINANPKVARRLVGNKATYVLAGSNVSFFRRGKGSKFSYQINAYSPLRIALSTTLAREDQAVYYIKNFYKIL